MLTTARSRRAMVVAPHALAAGSGQAVLREGGNALEAAVAMAATAGVVQPPLAAPGGDGVWLIHQPGEAPVAIDATGAAAEAATPDAYAAAGHAAVPERGPAAAATVAGAVSGWQAALDLARRRGGRLPLSRLLADAVDHARGGVPVSDDTAAALRRHQPDLAGRPGFAGTFLVDGAAPPPGARLRQPALANTLEHLARHGLDDFYRGEVGAALGEALGRLGSPLAAADLARHRSVRRRCLSLPLAGATGLGTPPPTQGLAALMLLWLTGRQGAATAEGRLHGAVAAARRAFQVRDRHVTDPRDTPVHPTTFLDEAVLAGLAGDEDAAADAWTLAPDPTDGVWLGCVDDEGVAVSLAQSAGDPGGSGVVPGDTGVLWHNRGRAFHLAADGPRALAPGRRPYSPLCPGLMHFDDGRVAVMGAAGGDAQPQAQALLYDACVRGGTPLQQAMTAPRHALTAAGVVVEARFDPAVAAALEAAGHTVVRGGAFDPRVGRLGALVRHPDGTVEGAADPRGDGAVGAL